jgi:hypothetical protein
MTGPLSTSSCRWCSRRLLEQARNLFGELHHGAAHGDPWAAPWTGWGASKAIRSPQIAKPPFAPAVRVSRFPGQFEPDLQLDGPNTAWASIPRMTLTKNKFRHRFRLEYQLPIRKIRLNCIESFLFRGIDHFLILCMMFIEIGSK